MPSMDDSGPVEPRGFVDGTFKGFLVGWALNSRSVEAFLDVELVVGDDIVARATARHMRGDLADVFGSGCHGFALPVPALARNKESIWKIRVAGTDFLLPWAEGLRETFDLTLEEPGESWSLSPEVFGAVETISPEIVEGWAWTDGPPGSIEIDVFWQGKLIASGRADGASGGFPAPFQQCAFRIALPPNAANGPEQISCVARTGSGTAPFPRLASSPGQRWGAFEVVDAARVVGWAARSGDGSAATLSVLCDGDVVWQGEASRRVGGSDIGFRVDLPDPADWSKSRTVSVVLADEKQPLGPDVTYEPKTRFRGHLDTAVVADGILTVQGWVCDTARPLDSLKVAIQHDGRLLARGVATDLREDVVAAGIGAHRCGFRLKAPWTSPSSPASIALVLVDRPQPIFLDFARDVTLAEAAGALPARVALKPAVDPRDCVWEGSIDTIRYNAVGGWVRADLSPNDPVLLDLYIDGSYYYSVLSGQHRSDVGRKFHDHGNYGFHFELPPHLITTKDRIVRVVPRHGKVSFPNEKVLPRTVAGQALNALPAAAGTPLAAASTSASAQPKVAYILLNLNAERLLLRWFETFERHNRYGNSEILVIDHGSTDGSLALCEAWSARLPVRTFARGRNHSFSESNNFGTENTDAEIFVFANNDIVFIEDIAGEVVRLLADDGIGMVGVRLLDTPLGDALSSPPVQHLGVHFSTLAREDAIQPFESRYGAHLRDVVNDVYDVPVVTGALMACRRGDFEAVGGFDPGYFYGYEDVDLCLRILLEQGKRVVSANSVSAMHMRGFSRGKSGPGFGQRLTNNKNRLHELFGRRLRRSQARDRFERPGFWSTVAPRIAFAVTEASDDAVAGDYFTALELALELAKSMTCQIVFLGKEDWFDLHGIDVLITMVDNYDLRKIKNASPHLLRIGWARNWIDRWAARDWSQDYDAMWASSRLSQEYLSRTMARPVELIQIATNPERFRTGTPRPDLASDYCFTGNYFSAPREIIYYLDPDALPFDFALYGSGWEDVPKLAPFSRGRISYGQMPDVYASTRVVIDDANSVTKEWGSVNSRVFDAIAAGALVVTNGRAGADELFDGLLPSYSTTQELEAHLRHFLTDEESRRKRVSQLQAILMERHTYAKRAETAQRSIRAFSANQLRFSIKIGAPREAVRNEWGDYHFALGLKRALTRLGHTVRIDCIDRWHGTHTLGDDVVLVLRGLTAYEPKPHQINLMWIISHPDAVARGEIERYDHVFVASTLYAAELAREAKAPVTPLLQCTDPELFNPDVEPLDPAPGLLFAGNSRNVYRQIVRDTVELGLPVEVYGSRWENFLPAEAIKGTYIPNEDLARHYRSAAWVLNDHWDDMRRWGFISNRVFDAVAAGGRVVSDGIAGLDEVFGDGVATYRTQEDLRAVLAPERDRTAEEARIRALSDRIRRDHSFAARAATILGIVGEHTDMLPSQPAIRIDAAGPAASSRQTPAGATAG